MNKLILLNDEQIATLYDVVSFYQDTYAPKTCEYQICEEIIEALSHELTDEIVEKIEYRKQRALDIPSNHSDSVAYGLDVAKEIIKSYGEEK